MKIYDVRKIQKRTQKKNGGTYETYFITLPQEWINEHNLKKGDKVVLKLGENKELIIEPQK